MLAVQVAVKEDHRVGSYEYMERTRRAIATELPHLSAYFQSGGMVDAVLNLTPRTVAFHKYRMMEQLRVKTTAELIQYAVKHHIV